MGSDHDNTADRSDRRSDAREQALILLYEADQRGESVENVGVLHQGMLTGLTATLALGVEELRPDLDALISASAHGWSMERMAVVDRNILRCATFELLRRPDVPTAVIIDEAIRLAKRFSTEDSGRFVNGVLAAIAAKVRSEG